jgi:Abnormal spindle-like microcephaly-assoc'd, ASPM-SPD-2-Hydin/Beta-propeller repeat
LVLCTTLAVVGAVRRAEPGSKSEPISRLGTRAAKPLPLSQSRATRARLAEQYGKLPLTFEANQGQTDPRVKFIARGGGYTLLLTADEAVLKLHGAGHGSHSGHRGASEQDPTAPVVPPAVLRMKLVGAHASPEIFGFDELAGKSNYFIGNDPANWRTNVPNYRKVRYRDTYPGVDLVYYGNQLQLEYDFVVAPGANPRAIILEIGTGARQNAPQVAKNGDLVVPTDAGEVRFHTPVVYQAAAYPNQERSSVDGRWVSKGGNRVGFEVAAYDARKPLVIDPVLSYSTYLGGSNDDDAQAMAVDSAGNAYLSGGAISTDFPTMNPFQPTNHGKTDAFVTKLNSTGSAVVYSTYLGGLGYDSAFGITVDASGNAYVGGETTSNDFPITAGAFQTVCGGGCAGGGASAVFVTALNSTGSGLLYSTFLGGSGSTRLVEGMAVDSAGHLFATGWTTAADFPTTPGAFQTTFRGTSTGFVTEFNTTGSGLVYSTFLGGSAAGVVSSIALDSAGHAFVIGWTSSTDFPTTAGAFQTTLGGGTDAFVTELNTSGSALVYSTYLGGSSTEFPFGVALDSLGNAYVVGFTCSSNYPITPGAFQAAYKSGSCTTQGGNGFVTQINATGTALVYSTFLGGTGNDVAFTVGVDASNVAHIAGRTKSKDFPITPGAFQPSFGGDTDAFVTELNAAGTALLYSTYLGGIGSDAGYVLVLDKAGNTYLAGRTHSPNFPTTPGSFDPTCSKCSHLLTASHAFAVKFASGDQVWPLSLSFGIQAVGTSSNPQITTLTNSGGTTLNITQIAITGANSGDFSQTHTCGTSLAAGASCTVSVIFKPLASGTRTAAVAITDDAANSPQIASLSGTGGGAVTLSPISLTFPLQVVSTTSQAQPVTLTNGGATALAITSIAATGPFSETNNCGSSLAAGANCIINATFKPTTKGAQSGGLAVTDNGTGSPQTATLTGTGTFVSLLPASLSFGNQAVGTTSSPQTVTVANQGNATVNISKISFTGTGAGSFKETTTCATTLGAGKSCTISVTFSPKAKGKVPANLAVSDNGGGSPQGVSLTGTGT